MPTPAKTSQADLVEIGLALATEGGADAVTIAGLLPDAELVRFGKESAHEILREVDPVRDRALREIDTFLSARAQQ